MLPSDLNFPFLNETIHQALETRQKYSWGPLISDSMFLNDVLPFSVLLEPRDFWRNANFTSFMSSLVSDCDTVTCAAQQLNLNAWNIVEPHIIFQAAPPNELNSYGVFETMNRHNSSCTGLSIFLIASLRSVGIPARIAGVLHWNKGHDICPNGDKSAPCGNHNWVEVFVPEIGWSFIDQRRTDLQVLPLNTSWFYPEFTDQMNDGTFNHSIFASSFADPTELMTTTDYWVGRNVGKAEYYPLAWDGKERRVHAWNVTLSYQEKTSLKISSFIY
jgi:Transglutaminase-like superfamily